MSGVPVAIISVTVVAIPMTTVAVVTVLLVTIAVAGFEWPAPAHGPIISIHALKSKTGM